MPNWTTNTIIIKGKPKTIKKIKEEVKSEKYVFDFEKILPIPETLNIESGSKTDESILIYLTKKLQIKPNKNNPKHKKIYNYVRNSFSHDWPLELYNRLVDEQLSSYKIEDYYKAGKQYIFNIETYNAPTWYEWCIENWGTKWNATNGELISENKNKLTYTFDTAWCHPTELLLAFSKKYPNVEIEAEYANEDDYETFYNITYKNGKIIM